MGRAFAHLFLFISSCLLAPILCTSAPLVKTLGTESGTTWVSLSLPIKWVD